jgi:hypothetical protein
MPEGGRVKWDKKTEGFRARRYINGREVFPMSYRDTDHDVDIEERHVEHKSDSSLVLSTFIKYAAYLIIFFGILYFIVRYVFPWFN